MTNGFGPTIENAKKRQEYINSLQQQFGELLPVEKTLREKSVDAATDVIGALPFGGGGDYYDRKVAKNLFGDYYADSIADSIGVLDFSPLGLVYGADEALREYKQAEKPIDYILPTGGLALAALEAYPLTKIATRPLRRFLSNLGNKTSVPTDISRRALLQGAIAAPVAAGALTSIPLGKVVDEVVPVDKEAAPVLKKVKNIKSMLRLTDLPQMKKSLIRFQAEDLGIELSDLSKEFGREIKSFDDLNAKEIDKVFEDNFLASGMPEDLFEDDLRGEISDAIADLEFKRGAILSTTPKNFIESKIAADSPTGYLLDDFINEMKKSGHSNEEISGVIDNSLDDLFNRATSLDDEMM